VKLTSISVNRRLSTVVIAVALLVLGGYGLRQLPVDFLPNITYPMIKLHIWWRGATAEEIEKSIAEPIERQMATVDGLDYLESSSIEGMYTLQVNFQYDVDIDTAYQDAQAALARIARELPKDMDAPVIIKADPSQLPVAQLTIRSAQWDLTRLRTWVDEWLQDQLIAVGGVAGTEIVGGLKREIRVHLDQQAMEKHGLSLPLVLKRLREENIEQFGGRITTGPREFIARTMGEFKSLDDIRNVVLLANDTARVYLRDIARVEDAHEEVRVITRLGGEPCVKLSVLKQADANTVEVARDVMARVRQLEPLFPAGIEIGIVENQADYVQAALNGVRNTALEASLLVVLTVFLFLGSWRQVLIMAIALPATMLINFGVMKLAGFSLNIFSLGGLVIAIGVVLDNSIIVLENITRYRYLHPDKSLGPLAVDATQEVGPAIVAATVSFLALFLPFLIVPGLMSLLFRELILVIAGVVLLSLIVAITLTPMLSAWLLRPGVVEGHARQTRFERFFERVTDRYGRLLGGALRWPRLVLAAFGVLLAGAVLLLPRVGGEFLPKMDDGRIMVKVKLPTGAALGETDKILKQVEALLADDPLIESYFTLSGGKVWGLYTYEIANEGEVNIQLVPRAKRPLSTKAYIEKLRPLAGNIPVPGGQVMVMPMKIKGIRQIGEADVEVKIKGQDTDQLFALARQTAAKMNELKVFVNVNVSLDLNKPEFQVFVDRARAAELGLAMTDVADSLRSLVSGAVATRFRERDEYYNIRVMVPETGLRGRPDLENLIIGASQSGGFIRLRDVARVVPAVGPVEIVREDQVKQVIVRGDVRGTSIAGAERELFAALGALDVPAGYEMRRGGQAQMMADMRRVMLAVLGFAIFFAFVALAVQFDSLRLPGLIIASVPFCLAGLVYLLWATAVPLGATVVIGILLVVGATVNDGVLLLTFAEELRVREKLSALAAVLQAAQIRLRPRVMTTLPLITGFIPLALNLEEGGELLQPMALAAIGGLTLEIAVALVFMPALYILVSSKKGEQP
jgi:HAE1 family hydrophobic/amphiphilic exporter-1